MKSARPRTAQPCARLSTQARPSWCSSTCGCRARTGWRSRRATPAAASRRVAFGSCMLDLDRHQLIGPAGEDIALTAMEFDLLRAFAEHPNRVLSRDQLLTLTRNREWEPFDRSIDIRIARLRRKIEEDPDNPKTIKTIRGSGYIFIPKGM